MMKTSWDKNLVLGFLTAVLLCVPVLIAAGEEPGGIEERLTDARKVLEDDYQVTVEDLQNLQALFDEITQAGLEEFIPDIRMLLFIAGDKYEGEEVPVSMEGEAEPAAVSRPAGGGGVPLTVSAVSAGLFNLFWILGDSYHSRYTSAETPLEASRLMPYWQAFDLLTYLSAGISILSFGIGVPQLALQPAVFALADPPGETIQEQTEYLLKAREKALKKRTRADRETYTLVPRVLFSTGLSFIITETLLFSMGSQVYWWNVPGYDYSSGFDPVTFSGMVIGIAGSSLLVSSLITALLNPPPSAMESAIARGRVELEKREYDTAPLQEEDRERLTVRQDILLEKLERGEAMKRWHSPVLVSAAGAGIVSLGVMTALLVTRENAEEALQEGSTWDGIIPSDGWIIGTGVAGGVFLSAAGVLLTFAPPVKKIREELTFIKNRLFERK